MLEPFSILNLEVKRGKGRLALLSSACQERCFPSIRSNLLKCAHAAYWTDLLNRFTREFTPEKRLFLLFESSLGILDQDLAPLNASGILFQLRLLELMGISPNLTHCGGCGTPLERIKGPAILFCMKRGGILCSDCPPETRDPIRLSPRTVRELAWALTGDLNAALRLKFSSKGMEEGHWFLEQYITYHLGAAPKSLSFLRKMAHGRPRAAPKRPADANDNNTCNLPHPGRAHP